MKLKPILRRGREILSGSLYTLELYYVKYQYRYDNVRNLVFGFLLTKMVREEDAEWTPPYAYYWRLKHSLEEAAGPREVNIRRAKTHTLEKVNLYLSML